jgi:hypothetical protein
MVRRRFGALSRLAVQQGAVTGGLPTLSLCALAALALMSPSRFEKARPISPLPSSHGLVGASKPSSWKPLSELRRPFASLLVLVLLLVEGPSLVLFRRPAASGATAARSTSRAAVAARGPRLLPPMRILLTCA